MQRDAFGELLARATENVMGVTKIAFDVADLIVRNLRLARRSMSARPARRRLRTIRSATSKAIFVTPITFSVARASSSPNASRCTVFSVAAANAASLSLNSPLIESSCGSAADVIG